MNRAAYKERVSEISSSLSPKDTALVIVDVQSRFCATPLLGKRTAKRIANITPQFRKAGFPIFIVAMDDIGQPSKHFSQVNFCKLRPDPKTDIFIPKTRPSAFSNPDMEKKLQSRGIKNLLVCGLYTTLCVTDTVRDGLAKSFNVCVLKDLISDFANWNAKSPDSYGIIDLNESLQHFQGMGALTKTSEQILNYYHARTSGK